MKNQSRFDRQTKEQTLHFHFSNYFSPGYTCLTRVTSSPLGCEETFQKSQTTSVSSRRGTKSEEVWKARRRGAEHLCTLLSSSPSFSEPSSSSFEPLSLTHCMYNTEDIYTNIYCFCFVNVNSGWLWKWLVSLFERWSTAGNPRLKVVEQASGIFSLTFWEPLSAGIAIKANVNYYFWDARFVWKSVVLAVWHKVSEPFKNHFKMSESCISVNYYQAWARARM